MSFVEIKGINKKYRGENGKVFSALSNISLSLPSSGLISIIGKSGSGKSTLLNIIGLLDKPDSGEVFINNQNMLKMNDKVKSRFRNCQIGFVFQHYHLLEKETVLFNVMLPMLMNQKNKKMVQKDATTLLEGLNISKELWNKKCQDLSGGEKERVALARSLINNAKIILADEPTGALDSSNSLNIMNILKKASATRLVIVVSHNQCLVESFSDRIITLKDGKIQSNKIFKEENHGVPIVQDKTVKKNKSWIDQLCFNNFKRRFKRNLVGIFSLTFGLVCSNLIIGFSAGAIESLKNETKKHLDIGSLTITKEKTNKIEGSPLSLVQTIRPNEIDLKRIDLSPYILSYNYDALLSDIEIIIGDEVVEGLFYSPIYRFDDNFVNNDLLSSGRFPNSENIKDVLVNKKAWDLINNRSIKIKSYYQYSFINNDNSIINDYFVFEQDLHVNGVVDEIDYLNSPKIYYSFYAFENYISSSLLNNLSKIEGNDISWAEIVQKSSDNDQLSSYSYRLFLKDINNINIIEQDVETLDESIKINSQALTIEKTLVDLVNAASLGMDVFLVIAIVGTAFILGILSFSSFVQDKKRSAILLAVGANSGDILDIFVNENLFIGLTALILSFILSPFFALLINQILLSTIGFANMVTLPYKVFLGIRFLFPLLLIVSTLLMSLLSSGLPIVLSRRISLKEELMDE